MIEYRSKHLVPGMIETGLAEWAQLNNPEKRTYSDFEWRYADYRIGDEVFTEMCPAFIDAFNKEKLWYKLKQ